MQSKHPEATKFPRSKYINQYLALRCQKNLKEERLFPKLKEVSESYSIIEAAAKLKIERKHDNVLFISVGDGVMPRTACLAAHMTKWTCIGIDPAMGKTLERRQRAQALADKTNRLLIIPDKVQGQWALENLTNSLPRALEQYEHVIFAFVHSHCSVKAALKKFSDLNIAKKHILSMPCCYEDDISLPKTQSYVDKHIASPKRTIHVYKDMYRIAEKILADIGLQNFKR